MVLLVGLPGSGKSTYLKRIGVEGLSSDTIRKWLADDETDQTIHDRVFETLRYLLRQRLQLARPVTYIDATNLTAAERAPYLGMARSYGCQAEALFFDVPLETCRARNRGRPRVVPDEVLDRMAARLAPPTLAEGFSRVELAAGG